MLLLTILGLEGAQILIAQNTISVRVSYHGNNLLGFLKYILVYSQSRGLQLFDTGFCISFSVIRRNAASSRAIGFNHVMLTGSVITVSPPRTRIFVLLLRHLYISSNLQGTRSFSTLPQTPKLRNFALRPLHTAGRLLPSYV